MARLEDIPQPTRQRLRDLDCPAFDDAPFVGGPPLHERRVAIVTSAALRPREEPRFRAGSAEVRFLDASRPSADLLMSHVSINFDRTGWQRDPNVVYPLDRLREMARDGEIGAIADTHYSVMGSTDPKLMADAAERIAGRLKQERVDAVLLSPV